ncbi:MAG TPA: OmpA family protein [Candidatus Binatia bacterium]|jgi:peptidoglycan-associated lipoprotein|nr:OmpA family protein [Candidatus Binatia bacterium]
MKRTKYLSIALQKSLPVHGLFLYFLLSACSTMQEANSGPKMPLMPPDMQNIGRDYSTRSVPAAEALSRGVAAVTPPGAALQDVYYEFDSIQLRGDAEEILKQNAAWIKANPTASVEIEGHCDDIGSDEYNLALGAKRAQIAKEFLLTQGIAADRLVTISYGKEAPACFERNEDCRVKNRRARFVVFTELPTSYTNVR